MLFVSDAWAQGAPAADPGGMSMIVVLAVTMALMYFVVIRPQAKRQRELKAMTDALAKGDEVVTGGGLVGRVAEIAENYITLHIGTIGDKPVSVHIQRSAVQTLLPKGTMKSLDR